MKAQQEVDRAGEQIQVAISALQHLEQAGWSVHDELRSLSIQVRTRVIGSTIVGILQPLLRFCTACDIQSEHGFRLTLARDRFELVEQPSTIDYYYDGDELSLAKRAVEGDTGAALGILEQWHASATVDLAIPLRLAEPRIAWRVARTEEVIIQALDALTWWRVGELVSSESAPLVCVLARSQKAALQAAQFAVADFSSLSSLVVTIPRMNREALVAATGFRPPNGICLPEELAPEVSTGVPQVQRTVNAFAAASAWAWLGNSMRIDSSFAWLEFFGLQRIEVQIGPSGIIDPDAQRAAVQLYRWATSDTSADRVLAVRQVISIYNPANVLNAADDIRIAAEPIYRALRSSAVAEVFAAHRQAQQLAIAAARSSSEATQASAKALTERTIAALIAVGGLVLSKIVAPAISQVLYSQLALGLSVFMLALAIWAWMVEGRFVKSPVDSFLADIDQLADVLGDEQRSAIKKLNSVTNARRNALVVRIAAPAVYLCIAAIALWLRDVV